MSQVTTSDQADENLPNQLIDIALELERRVGSDETGGGASNGFVSQQPTPNMTVLVSAIPAAYFGDTLVRKTTGAPYTSPALTASTAGNYIALLTLSTAAALAFTTGTPSTGTPSPPAVPAGLIPLAEVYVRQGATGGIYNADQGTTNTNYIQWDTRPTLQLPSGVGASSSITSAMILDGTIVNADVSTGAAIAYSKLSLTGSVVNADVSTAAAIAAYKLNFPFVVATGTSYAVGSTDFAILANPSSNQAITLPASSGMTGEMLRIKRWSTQGTVTIHAASSSGPQLIDGSTSYAMSTPLQAIDLLPSTGLGWAIF